MLLTDEDIAEISLSAVTVKDATEDVRSIEAAILAKLASAELPEPAGRVMAEHNGFVRGRLYRIEDRIDGKPLYTADQLRQAYAQGAAAQLAEKPSAWRCPNWSGSLDKYAYRDADDCALNAKGEQCGEPLTLPEKWKFLYTAVNNLLVFIGREGSVSSDSASINTLSNAMHDIDGGTLLDDAEPKALEPLTDEQIYNVFASTVEDAEPFSELVGDPIWAEVVEITRAIEAAHGITKGTP